MEHHLEARALERRLHLHRARRSGCPRGLIRATVLIETLPAAFQMDEIIYELGEHSYGLNAGRWDYIFSMIKVFRDDPDFVLPDRNDVKMTVPFMRAYTELLVKTCHARGAFAMGGMAALIPSRKDEEANQRAIDAVKADKEREAKAGFDGTWVAHPDVVDVALAAFDEVLGDRPNQIDKQRYDVDVTPEQLLDAASTPGEITEEGLRCDVNVGFQYISFWLGGRGAAGINNLMEDAATAEISRSQIWQWVRHGKFERDHVREILDEEMEKIRAEVGDETWEKGRPDETRRIFEQVALARRVPGLPHAARVRVHRLGPAPRSAAATLALMSRLGRWVVIAVSCLLVAAPAARAAAPTPTVKAYDRSSPAKPAGRRDPQPGHGRGLHRRPRASAAAAG